jgi:hypothetical protein
MSLLERLATRTVIVLLITCAFLCAAQSSHGLRTDKYLVTRKEFLKKSQTYLLKFTRSGKVYKKARDISGVDEEDSEPEGTTNDTGRVGSQTDSSNAQEEQNRPRVCGKWQLSPTGSGVSFWLKDGDTVERYSAEVCTSTAY